MTLIARIREEAAAQIERLRAEHKAAIDAAVQAAVAAILRRYYGPRSERFDPRQVLLFGQTVDTLPLEEASIAEESGEELVTRRIQKRHKHGRQQLPEHLERIELNTISTTSPAPHVGASGAALVIPLVDLMTSRIRQSRAIH